MERKIIRFVVIPIMMLGLITVLSFWAFLLGKAAKQDYPHLFSALVADSAYHTIAV